MTVYMWTIYPGMTQGDIITISKIDNNHWNCHCNKCDSDCVIRASSIRYGATCCDECRHVHTPGAISHGLEHTRLYQIYKGMKERCYYHKSKYYKDYGGRGIYICDEWYTPGVKGNPGFVTFYNWAYMNGYYDQPFETPYKDRLSIDRIDNNGPYAPWNCQWIPISDRRQTFNRRTNHPIFDGERFVDIDIFERTYELRIHIVAEYRYRGWSDSAIVYMAKHRELGIHKIKGHNKNKIGSYVDKDGFYHVIPILYPTNQIGGTINEDI